MATVTAVGLDPALTATDRVDGARRRPARRHRRVVAGLTTLAIAVFAARVLLGDFTFTIPDFFRILLGADMPGATFILMEVKLPRAVVSLLVGLAFGVAGAVFQSTLRNPLASPDLIGVSVGASAAAVVAIVLLGLLGPAVSVAAVVGALLCALVVRFTAGDGGAYRLVLAGIGVSAALLSMIQYVFTRADVWDAQLVLRWLTGSVSNADWPTIRVLTLALLALLPATAWAARAVPVLELGDDAAAGLGVGRRRTDLLLVLAVLLTAVGVAAAGPVAFVAFLSGPIARFLNGGRTTLLGSGLVGVVIVVGADYVADYAMTDVNLPVGVVTGALGAPFLLWLLASGRTGRSAR